MPTYQQHMAALKRATEAGDTEAVAYIRGEAIKAMQQEEATARDTEERSRPFMQRAMTNIGAGMTNLGVAARDIAGDMGIGPKVSDEEIREKRAIDDKLASQTTGGGLLQVAGEIAPTLVVPAGGAGAAARLAGRALPRAVGRTTLGRATMGSAVGGAAGGALQATTEDESRGTNMAVGAAAGGAVPSVLKMAMAGGRAAGRGAQQMAAGLPDWVPGSQAAARAVGGREVGRRLTASGISESDASRAYRPHVAVETQPSAAVASQNEKIAMLERASRTENPAAWSPFDEANQTARWKALDDNLLNQSDVEARLAKADEVGEAAPYAEAGMKRFNKAMDNFYAKLQQAKATAEYKGNPAVRSAVDYVENTMRDAGTVTPQLMHEMRKTLGKGLTGVPGAGEQGVRAATKDPFVLSLMGGIDDVMEHSTKGKWGGWKGDYSDAMTKAERAKADVNVRGHFVNDFGTPRTGPVSVDNQAPRVTGVQLKNAMEKYGVGKKGPRKGSNLLETNSEDVLLGVKRDLDAEDILQRVKRAGTSGGGSDTGMNLKALQNLGIGALLDPLLGGGRMLHNLGGAEAKQQASEQLARLLQSDPDAIRLLLQKLREQEVRASQVPMLPGAGLALGGATAN